MILLNEFQLFLIIYIKSLVLTATVGSQEEECDQNKSTEGETTSMKVGFGIT